MRTFGRFVLGFIIGCVLFLWAMMLAGAGHGTLAPLASVAPPLLPVFAAVEKSGLLGFWLVMVPGNGFLWAIYFGLLPGIKSFVVRMLIVLVIALMHFGPGVWALSKDTAFADMANRQPVLTIGYFMFFWLVLIALGARTWAGPNYRLRNVLS